MGRGVRTQCGRFWRLPPGLGHVLPPPPQGSPALQSADCCHRPLRPGGSRSALTPCLPVRVCQMIQNDPAGPPAPPYLPASLPSGRPFPAEGPFWPCPTRPNAALRGFALFSLLRLGVLLRASRCTRRGSPAPVRLPVAHTLPHPRLCRGARTRGVRGAGGPKTHGGSPAGRTSGGARFMYFLVRHCVDYKLLFSCKLLASCPLCARWLGGRGGPDISVKIS